MNFGQVAAAGACVAVLASGAQAATITYTATGTVANVDSVLASQFSVGQAVSFTFAYDTSKTDLEINTFLGVYVNALTSGFGSVGSYVFSLSTSNIIIRDNAPNDQFFAIGGASGASVGAYNLGSAGIVLTDATNAVFINDNLPTGLNLSDFTAGQRLIELNFILGGDFSAVVEANISELSIAQDTAPRGAPALCRRPWCDRISRASQEAEGSNVMGMTIDLETAEDILNWDVSDEALEIAGAAGPEIAGGYTLQFCTSMDCALVS